MMVNKIFNEGDVMIPLHSRKDFKMVCEDPYGKQYYSELKNSDLVFLNDFYDKLKIKEYTSQKRALFMRKKELIVRLLCLLMVI